MQQGGVERGAVEIAQALVAAGHRALVASNGGRLEAALRRVGAEHIQLPLHQKMPWSIRRNAASLQDIITSEGVDIVHARSRAPAWAGYQATKATNTPFVTTYHGVYQEKSLLKKRYNSVMAKGQPVIAISQFIHDLVQKRYQTPSHQIVVIPRGADVSIFAEELVSAERTVSLITKWGVLDDPRPIVLVPARLSRWKGHGDVLEAAKHLKYRGIEFQIVLTGEGSAERTKDIEQKIIDKKLRGHVQLVGHTTDMEAAYKLSAVVVSAATEPEAFGRIAVEAQAMGRPVIASAHGGSLETIEDGKTGWLYPPGDATALADRIEEALTLDPSARAHMGVAGRARIRSRFTVEAMANATLGVYRDIAAKKSRFSM